MKIRHRVPMIFTLYMVDVLCCALGCVILLWQVNYQEAQDQTATADERAGQITALNNQLKSAQGETASLQEQNGAAQAQIAALEAKLQENARAIAALLQSGATLKADLLASRKTEAGALLTISKLSSELGALGVEVKKVTGELKDVQQKKALVTLELADLRKEHEKAQQLALVTKKDYEETRQALAVAKEVLDTVRVDLKKVEARQTTTASELAAKIKEHEAAVKQLKNTELQVLVLEKDMAARVLDNRTTVKLVDDLTLRLKTSEDNAKKLEATLASLQLLSKDYLAKLQVADLRSQLLDRDVEKNRKEILEAAKRYQELVGAQELLAKRLKITDKELAEARKTNLSLQADRLSLVLQARALRDAADNRFAGIKLTGERVVFLVDMSGSMAMADGTTKDPDKWPEVCGTIAQIMKSLPDLKKYQVILFSDKVKYAFGSPRRWLDYDAAATPKFVLDGLRKIQPDGDTDLHAAFEEAFTLRAQGLDTMYVLSDGLPTTGEGAPGSVTDAQRTDLLSKYVRNRLKNVWNVASAGKARVRINTIGFFFESPEVGSFLWALSRENDGSFVGMR